MKALICFIFMAALVPFILCLHSCAITAPTSVHPNTPTPSVSPTPTPTYQPGTVVVNNAATGACPVKVWLDTTGPVTVSAGTLYTFASVPYGSHNLTFNTTSAVTCVSTPVACEFYYYGTITTGYSCSFYLQPSQIQTAAITDNGCNQLTVTCPY